MFGGRWKPNQNCGAKTLSGKLLKAAHIVFLGTVVTASAPNVHAVCGLTGWRNSMQCRILGTGHEAQGFKSIKTLQGKVTALRPG